MRTLEMTIASIAATRENGFNVLLDGSAGLNRALQGKVVVEENARRDVVAVCSGEKVHDLAEIS